LKQMVDRQTI